jgi:hypothetical protein
MMTISNPGSSLHLEKNFHRDRFKVKSVLFLFTFLSFGFNLIGQNSGNAQDLEQFKSTWMTEHEVQSLTPAQYAQMKTDWYQSSVGAVEPIRQFKTESNDPDAELRIEQFKKWQGENFASGFPVKELTGDAEMDNQIYQAKKQDWINKYPALYEKMTPDDGFSVSEREAIRVNELNQNKIQK